MERVQVIDAHAGGEPTRVVVEGGPDLGKGTVRQKLEVFRTRFDDFRHAIIGEPRGGEFWVGALMCKSSDPSCISGVIFFNNQGYLGMCGHGTMCVAVALAYLGHIKSGIYKLETPVGTVQFSYDGECTVTVISVPSYRYLKDVVINIKGYGKIKGDIAWGGNWFFLTEEHGQDLNIHNIDQLITFAHNIRLTLQHHGITGADRTEIDHIALYGPPHNPWAHSRNFVLCPGRAFDRSPCGTGTSAKIACLIADGKLKPGEVWRQESIIGSCFEAWGEINDLGQIIPFIRGNAYITAETTLLFHPRDPFKYGILNMYAHENFSH
ncbi:MAG: proline racemase family protein [Nitrososphaerota archaeon]